MNRWSLYFIFVAARLYFSIERTIRTVWEGTRYWVRIICLVYFRYVYLFLSLGTAMFYLVHIRYVYLFLELQWHLSFNILIKLLVSSQWVNCTQDGVNIFFLFSKYGWNSLILYLKLVQKSHFSKFYMFMVLKILILYLVFLVLINS